MVLRVLTFFLCTFVTIDAISHSLNSPFAAVGWFGRKNAGPPQQINLHIVGCGRLGQYVCDHLVKQCEAKGSTCHITAETRSGVLKPVASLGPLRSIPGVSEISIVPRTTHSNEKLHAKQPIQFLGHKVLAFPPYGRGQPAADGTSYLSEIADCVTSFQRKREQRGTDGTGKLIMVSTTGLYADNDDEMRTEATTITPKTAYVARLQEAEQLVLDAGGYVIRLGGLYDADSGPQNVYLRRLAAVLSSTASSSGGSLDKSTGGRSIGGVATGTVAPMTNRLLRLVSYPDAAALICALLAQPNAGGADVCASGPNQRVLLGLDTRPMSSRAILGQVLATSAGRARLESYMKELRVQQGDQCSEAPDLSTRTLVGGVDAVFDRVEPDKRSASVRYDDRATRRMLPQHMLRYPSIADYFKDMAEVS